MPIKVNIHEAKTHLSKLVERVLDGEEVIIARAGTPVARLVPIVEQRKQRVPGSATSQIVIAPDFDAPLPDDLLETFEQ
jgi:prevent-host-death family protein